MVRIAHMATRGCTRLDDQMQRSVIGNHGGSLTMHRNCYMAHALAGTTASTKGRDMQMCAAPRNTRIRKD